MIWYYPMIVVVKIMLDILAVYVGYTSFFLESSLQGALLCWLHIFFPESLQGAWRAPNVLVGLKAAARRGKTMKEKCRVATWPTAGHN